jgi:glycosyltransferase involved in cell wall biosynthesis
MVENAPEIKRKIKIAFVCSPLQCNGGTLNHLLNWCRHIDLQTFSVGLFCNFVSKNDLQIAKDKISQIPGIEFFPVNHLFPLKNLLCGGFLNFRKILRQFKPDIIHTIFIQADIICALLNRSVKARHQVSSWEGALVGQMLHSRLTRFIYRMTYFLIQSRISNFIAISHATARENSQNYGIDSNKVKTIHSGLDLHNFSYKTPEANCTHIGLISRLTAEKKVELFIHAIAKIHPEYPDIRFSITGDGDQKEKLIKLANELGLAEKISFNGWCENSKIEEILHKLDIFVFTSSGEGIPWAILEAMATGRPTIASAVGGIPEIIKSGKNGFLVDKPEPMIIYEKLKELIENFELRKSFSENARSSIEKKFSMKSEISALQDLYVKLLSPSSNSDFKIEPAGARE